MPPVDVRKIRERLEMTREQFAETFTLSCRTLEGWEQGLRKPQGPAALLLRVIDYAPDVVIAAIKPRRRRRR